MKTAAPADNPGGGWVYVLENEHVPNKCKIGTTDRDPELRAQEISRPTGLPSPHRVVFKARVVDGRACERALHEAFRNRRLLGEDPRNEWFAVSFAAVESAVRGIVALYALPEEPCGLAADLELLLREMQASDPSSDIDELIQRLDPETRVVMRRAEVELRAMEPRPWLSPFLDAFRDGGADRILGASPTNMMEGVVFGAHGATAAWEKFGLIGNERRHRYNACLLIALVLRARGDVFAMRDVRYRLLIRASFDSRTQTVVAPASLPSSNSLLVVQATAADRCTVIERERWVQVAQAGARVSARPLVLEVERAAKAPLFDWHFFWAFEYRPDEDQVYPPFQYALRLG